MVNFLPIYACLIRSKMFLMAQCLLVLQNCQFLPETTVCKCCRKRQFYCIPYCRNRYVSVMPKGFLERWLYKTQWDSCRMICWGSIICLFYLQILAAALKECHRKSSAQGKPLALKIFVAGRNRLENDGATALAEAFGVSIKPELL